MRRALRWVTASGWRTGAVLVAWALVLGVIALALGWLPSGSARANDPLYVCSTVRDRKVCNVEAVSDVEGANDWTGRFAACAPQPVSVAVPITDEGGTVRIVLWCGP